MSVEQIESTLLQLPPAERRRFADWFYQHEKEILDPQEPTDWAADLSAEQKAEILRRRDECEAHPELLEPWEGTTERLHARLNEIRAQKAASSHS